MKWLADPSPSLEPLLNSHLFNKCAKKVYSMCNRPCKNRYQKTENKIFAFPPFTWDKGRVQF